MKNKSKKINKRRKKLLIIGILILMVCGFVIFSYNASEQFKNFTGYVIFEFTGPDQSNVSVNFNEEVGIIRPDFYGVSNFNGYLSDLSYISPTGDWTILSKRSDSSFTRDAFINSNLEVFRSWAFLSLLSAGEGAWNNNDINNSYHATLWNIDALTDQNKWAYENEKTMMYNIASMPSWLADTTSGWCDESPIDGLDYSDDFMDTSWSSCSPADYTKYQDMIIDLALNISNNCEYADNIWFNIGNEIEGINWLNNLPIDDPIKALEFVRLYNHSYNALKSICDERFKIGGYSGLRFYSNMHKNFLSNMSDKIDFYSENIYSDNYAPYIETNTMAKRVDEIVSDCSAYKANCSHIIISEWGYIFDSIEGDNYMEADLSYVYLSMLNKYPSNISLAFHEFMLPVNAGNYKFISEPSLDNSYYPPYNVTKKISTYHSSGNMVVQSNPSLNKIKSVASKKDDESQYITIINTGWDSYLILSIIDNSNQKIKDIDTEEIYEIIDGSVDVGIISRYQVRYFVNVDESSAVEAVQLPANPSSSTSGGTKEISKINSKVILNDSHDNKTIEKSQENKEIEKNPEIIKIQQDEIKTGKAFGTGFAIFGTKGKTNWINLSIFSLIIVIFIVLVVVIKRLKKQNKPMHIL